MALDVFVSAGLYDPQSARADERKELLEHLLNRGFSEEQVIEAWRGRMPTHIAASLTRRGPALLSLGRIAELTGLDLERLVALRLALGFDVKNADAEDVPETMIEDVELFKFGMEQFGEERTLALARVIGDAIARIVEATRAAFSASVVEASMTELQVSEQNEVANAGWAPLGATIDHLLREWSASGYEFFEAILDGDAVLAVAFIDLVESTRWTGTLSLQEHNDALLLFERIAWESAVRNGGRMIKLIGDEAMVVATDPSRAASIAVEVCEKTSDEARLPSARAAIGVGSVTVRGGDVFGPLVNLVARATKEAPPGKVVATLLGSESLNADEWQVDYLGHRSLRGVDDPTELYVVARR